MRILIISVYLLYAANGYAMHMAIKKLSAVTLATSPITVTGTYYYQNSKHNQALICAIYEAKCKENGCIRSDDNIEMKKIDEKNKEQLRSTVETLGPFIHGATVGIIPLINVAALICVCEKFSRWMQHQGQDCQTAAMEAGALSGLSLYATVPLALKWLHKIK